MEDLDEEAQLAQALALSMMDSAPQEPKGDDDVKDEEPAPKIDNKDKQPS